MNSRPWILGLWLAGTAAAFAPVAAAAPKPIARYTAFAVDMSGRARGVNTATVDIVIERWSTDEERARLAGALKEGGSDALLKALQKVEPRVGYVSTSGSLAYPLRFAHQTTMASGSQRVLLGTDRRMSFLELQGARTMDYPFMIIDIRFGPDGKGQGKLLPVARVRYDPDDVVEIENYDAEPVRLTSVKKAD